MKHLACQFSRGIARAVLAFPLGEGRAADTSSLQDSVLPGPKTLTAQF